MNKKTLAQMNEVLKMQGNKGTYNCNSYMLGMYNGMELMMSIAERREPIYKSCKTEEFLDNKPDFKLEIASGEKTNE